MAREIILDADQPVSQASYEAIVSHRLEKFNPYLATKFRIDEQVTHGAGDVRLTAAELANGGPVEVYINGQMIDEGGAMSKLGLKTVVDSYKPGQGEKIAEQMLKGATLVLRKP